MIRILWTILICLLLVIPLAAEELIHNQEEMTPTQIILKHYWEQGYDILGPAQYIGKTYNEIQLHRHRPVSYRVLDMKDKNGERVNVSMNDYVYLLSKDSHVVLIRLERMEGGEPNV